MNALNQYTQRTVSGKADVFGIANPIAHVTVRVTGRAAYTAAPHGEYCHHTLTVGNNVYPEIEVTSLYRATATRTRRVFDPPATELFTHDADGNVTQDRRWVYVWDGENRLIEMRRDATSPAGAQKKLTFEYDWQGCRIRKMVYQGDGNQTPTWTKQSDTVFLCDGWNLIAQINANSSNAKIRTYVWGNDLSGTIQGTRGVGGLLKVVHWTAPSTSTHHFVAYDGNGNVMALVQDSNGSVSARYEYAPSPSRSGPQPPRPPTPPGSAPSIGEFTLSDHGLTMWTRIPSPALPISSASRKTCMTMGAYSGLPLKAFGILLAMAFLTTISK